MKTSKSALYGVAYCVARVVLLVVLVGIGLATHLWAQTDPCSAPSFGTGTGIVGSANGASTCGVVITVTAVDANGSATAFFVTLTGNGNPYDGTEDTLVGVVNSSGASLNVMGLTSANTTFGGLFNFDTDGPCLYNPSDCHGSTGYEGPQNTFTIGPGTPCTLGTCFTSGTLNFNPAVLNNGTTWFALEGTPQSLTAVSQTGQSMNPDSAANLAQNFVFNNTVGQHVEFDFDYTTAFNTNNDLTVVSNTIPTISDQGITHATYQQMVAGTSLAMTDCFTAPGEGTDANGNALCAQLTITCTNSNSNTPSGDNCPQSTQRNLYWAHQLDTPGTGFTIPSGSAPSLPMGSDSWSPNNCTLTGPETGRLCPQSMLTQFELTSTDNGVHPGGAGTTTNSSLIAGCCQLEWNTVPSVPVWSNNSTVPVSFTAFPPNPANPTNNWVAAPNHAITWGEEKLAATPDTTFPVPGDATVTNPTACPSAWPAPGTVPSMFTASGSVVVPGEGNYEVHFFSTACDNQEELLFPGTTTTGSTKNLATFKTAPFSVDSTAPTVAAITLNPPGGYIAQNAPLAASVTCTDPSSPTVPGLFSGMAQCGSQGSPQQFTGQQTVTTTPISLSTSALGAQTFTAIAKDVAGNSSSPTAVTYQVVGPDNLAIGMLGNFRVKTGTNMTYTIFVVNSGPNTANLVTVTDTLPAGTAFVSSGYAIESCTISWGLPHCSITPPTNSCGSVIGSCAIGNLPVWNSKNAIGAVIQITVKVTANPNTTIKDTAMVSGANFNNDLKFTKANWQTSVTK